MILRTKKRARVLLDDASIVELYWQRDEGAIRETDVKYGKYLHTVAYNIVHDTLDSEECLNDTYLGAWNAMPPNRPGALKAFLVTIMRRIAINRYHHKRRAGAVPSELTLSLTELEDVIAEDGSVVDEYEAARLGGAISEFARSLPQRQRYIFMSRYYTADPIDAIARELGVSRATVNRELATIRASLKEALAKEGFAL